MEFDLEKPPLEVTATRKVIRMMASRLFLGGAVPAQILLLVAVGAAQQRPDMSGTWVATKDAPAALAAAPAPVFGPQFALRQDGQALTVVRRVRDAHVAASYTLDGSEVRNRIPGGLCMADSESVERAAWDGNGIVLTAVGSVPPGGGAMTALNVRRVLRLESPDTLIVEGTMRDNAQATSRAVATVYKRYRGPGARDSGLGIRDEPGEAMAVPAAAAPAVEKTPATIAQVAWMSGGWATSSGSDERWTTPAGGSMLAVARTLRNGVMSAFEFLCVVERGGTLVYQAMPNGRMPATDFTLTRIEPASATFENPAHDFPKMIRYTLLPGGTLEAVVGGDPKQKALTFLFKRQP